jgi:hypothetical protein
MKTVELGTPLATCERCDTPVVVRNGETLYCYGAAFEVELKTEGKTRKHIDVQQAQVHNCDRDAAHYRATAKHKN